MTPAIHASLLSGATLAALLFAGTILARNPQSTPARMHAIYGGTVAWWFYCMSMIATATIADVQFWARLVHISIGMLPGVIFHLNVATAGLAHEHRRAIRVHYALSVLVTFFCITWPGLFDSPNSFSWGPYAHYTAWGLIPASFLAVTFAEVLKLYRDVLRRVDHGTAYYQKAKAFYHGNAIAFLAMVDFLVVFGIGVYPFGFLIITALHAATVFGSIRYRLIEITPEYAAEQILRTLPDGVLVVDSQGLVRVANKAVARIIGQDLRDLIDRPVASVVKDEELLQAFAAPVWNDPSAREVGFESLIGERHVAKISSAIIRDQVGEPIARVWVLHDLTAQRLAEAQNEMLEGWVRHGEKLKTLGVLVGGIAHDFNNLLMAILGSADMAKQKLDDGQSIDSQLDTIASTAERATALTSQMLAYTGKRPTTKEEVDLNLLIREMTVLLGTAISKLVKFEFKFADQLPVVMADRGQIGQIILNLITNASDALGKTTGTITIRTGVIPEDAAADELFEKDTQYAFLEVIDTGVGMDQVTQEQMFDPFFTTKSSGHGLGLAMVIGIVEAHSGRVRVESIPGQGTQVMVALPTATHVPNQAKGEKDELHWSGEGLALVVDDETGVRQVAQQMLTNAGFSVIQAANGIEALESFREHRAEITLVLLDLNMPKIDGKNTLSRIRSLSADVPVILMSGYVEADAASLIASDNNTSFINKPFRQSELGETVQSLVVT
ncbi:MAG: response regulator [Pseudomonadales bacterium]